MRRYDSGDMVTFYFIIFDDGVNKRIQAWTDEKEYAKAYIDFHKCQYYHLKKVHETFDEVIKVINENVNDEIQLHNITIRDTERKKGRCGKTIVVPMTVTERVFVNEEINTFMASRVNYGYVNEAFSYLRNKYQKALRRIFFEDIMNYVIMQKRSPVIENIELDELMVLFRSFPDHFGQ